MKIIIAGDGKVGITLAKELSGEGHDLTVIDSNRQVLEDTMEKYDLISVCGNCAAMTTLQQASVNDADLLIAATGADEVNLLCCMTAHSMNPKLHTIARIRNPEYSHQAYAMRDQFGLSLVVNPERQAAGEIERLLRLPGFLRRDTFAKGRVEIVELRVDSTSRLAGKALKNMSSVVKCKVLVCAVLRNGAVVMPGGDFILQEDDRIFVTAPTIELATLMKNLGIVKRKANKVMLAGGGRISYYLAKELAKGKVDVRLLEQDPARCAELAKLLPGVTVIQGDASSDTVLERENLGSCDALVALTGLDEINIMISMYATVLGVPQVITKVSRMESSSLLDNLPIGSVICPKELCCNNIVRYVRAMQNQTGAAFSVHTIAAGRAESMEFLVSPGTLHIGEPLKNIRLKPNVLMACISHGERTEIPNGDSCYHAGDTLIIVTNTDTVIGQLNDIFQR